MSEAREAPINDPTTGKLAVAALVGAGAGEGEGEGTSTAITALMEAAVKMIAHAIFFISIGE